MRFLSSMRLSDAELFNISRFLRYQVMNVCLQADNGHLGACAGAVELLTGLYFGGVARINPLDDKDPDRDYIMMRGHTGPLRYPIFNLLGWIEDEELSQYRRFGSRLHGHEDHHFTPGVDVGPNGSLGMLLSYGTGIALRRTHTGNTGRVFVFIGDGEEQEGNVSEAARHAAILRLSNLVAIIDRNRKQLSDPVASCDNSDLRKLWEGYGWRVIELHSGNNLALVAEAYSKALSSDESDERPVLIIADTVKGLGVPDAQQHFSGYHTLSTVSKDKVSDARDKALAAVDFDLLSETREKILSYGERVSIPDKGLDLDWTDLDLRVMENTPTSPNHCQFDYFSQLSKWISSHSLRNDTYFLTADVTRQDHVNTIGIHDFAHFYNVGIREQHLISFAHGLSQADPRVRIIINSVDAFSLRASDQLLAAAQGMGSFCIIGDVAGLTNGKNGKTHQSSVQPLALRDIPGVTYLEPYDSVDMFSAMNRALQSNSDITYIRVHNAKSENSPQVLGERNLSQYVAYEPMPGRPVDLIILTSGCIVDEAVKASIMLSHSQFNTRVINVVGHSPDSESLRLLGEGIPILTAYNGVTSVLESFLGRLLMLKPGATIPATSHRGFGFGTTGDYQDLLLHFELDSDSLVSAGEALLVS